MPRTLSRPTPPHIPSTWSLPEVILTRLGNTVGRQRVIAEQGHTLIVLHALPDKDDHKRSGVIFWRNADGKWDSNQLGGGSQALMAHIEKYESLHAAQELAYENADDALVYFEILETINPVVRASKNMATTLQQAREIVGEELIDMRNHAEEAARNFELLHGDCKNALDYAIAKKTEEQSLIQHKALLASHRLNILMAIFLPITAIGSLFGMNMSNGLESVPWAFGAAISASMILGYCVRNWVLSSKE